MITGRPTLYPVRLTPQELTRCDDIICSAAPKTIKFRLRVLVGLNNCEPGKLTYGQVAAATNKTKNFVTSVAKRYCQSGFDGVISLGRSPKSDVARLRLNSTSEAHLIRLACSSPPDPYHTWSIPLLTREFNAFLESNDLPGGFSQTAVWRGLQRNNLQPHRSEYWCIRETTPEMILRMERVLHLYSLPYDPKFPIICMDEAAILILLDAKERLEVKPGFIEKCDYEYVRRGVKDIFLFKEPKTGQYVVEIADRRTAVEWAHHIRNLVDGPYRDAEKVILIVDNLNTHQIESLYKAFPPEEARRIAKRIEIVYTPVHASWLNAAENGINSLKRGCIDDRFRTEAEVENLPACVAQWVEIKNEEKTPVRWTFTVEEARTHPHLTMSPTQEPPSSSKYGEQNALCTPSVAPVIGRTSLLPVNSEDDGNTIDLCRCVDKDGNEYWAISLEEKSVTLREPVGKKAVASILHQKNTTDGWKIPAARVVKSRKDRSESAVKCDYNFQAHGEDVIGVYAQPYNEQYPVVCVRKRGYDVEDLSKNTWVGNLHAEPKPKRIKNTDDEPEATSQESQMDAHCKEQAEAASQAPKANNQMDEAEQPDSRLGLTFFYEPYTGQKSFLVSDMKDDLSWAESLKNLVDKMYPFAKTIKLIMNPEDEAKISALERMFTADEALRIRLKLDIHTVPQAAPWLNFAEVEAISVCRQCLKDGVTSPVKVGEYLASWQSQPTFVECGLTEESFREAFAGVYKSPIVAALNPESTADSTQGGQGPPMPQPEAVKEPAGRSKVSEGKMGSKMQISVNDFLKKIDVMQEELDKILRKKY